MTLYEAITIAAILVGPVLAVAVQISAERRRQLKDAKNATFRLLVGTRHLPSDPAYSTAINMVPIDFNRVPKVMSAYNAYLATIRYVATPENINEHNVQIITKQTNLIFEMSKHLGYNLPETEIQANPYAAGGFIQRDNLMLSAWEAWPRIAEALEKQTAWIASQQVDEEK